jgi:hypothetical protein
LARFDSVSTELKGFIIRDMSGFKVHLETLTATTGVRVEEDMIPPRQCVSTLDDLYAQMYHNAINNHLQPLIRVLGLHYNGHGWQILRQQLRNNIPADHPLFSAWLSPERKTLDIAYHLRKELTANVHVGSAF